MTEKEMKEQIAEHVEEIQHLVDTMKKNSEYRIVGNNNTTYDFTLFCSAMKNASAHMLGAMGHYCKFTKYNGEGIINNNYE